MQEELNRKLAEINHKTVEIEKRDAKIEKMQRLIREIKALDDETESMEIGWDVIIPNPSLLEDMNECLNITFQQVHVTLNKYM